MISIVTAVRDSVSFFIATCDGFGFKIVIVIPRFLKRYLKAKRTRALAYS